jgi:hypothetical protein
MSKPHIRFYAAITNGYSNFIKGNERRSRYWYKVSDQIAARHFLTTAQIMAGMTRRKGKLVFTKLNPKYFRK